MNNTRQNKGLLYLIPTCIADGTEAMVIPRQVFEVVAATRFYLAENPKSARKFIRQLVPAANFEEIEIRLFNKKTNSQVIPELLNPLLKGNNCGIISEAGAPAIADPGAEIVKFAHLNSVKIVPLVGPSSLLLALMASGFNGQNFTFHGYLPVNKVSARQKIKKLERISKSEGTTHIFIETPYRNIRLLNLLISTCAAETRICIASDITGKNEFIVTRTVAEWSNRLPEINKIPAIFLLSCQ